MSVLDICAFQDKFHSNGKRESFDLAELHIGIHKHTRWMPLNEIIGGNVIGYLTLGYVGHCQNQSLYNLHKLVLGLFLSMISFPILLLKYAFFPTCFSIDCNQHMQNHKIM